MKKILITLLVVVLIAMSIAVSNVGADEKKFDFWQVAKIQVIDGQLTNTVAYGEKGYVYNLGNQKPPYKVAGYTFVESDDTQAGVTIYWYKEDTSFLSPYKVAELPEWKSCVESVSYAGLVGMETAGEQVVYKWNETTGLYDGPFHSVMPGEKGYTNPLLPGGNIAGYYPACYLNLGGGGKYYFYRLVGQ